MQANQESPVVEEDSAENEEQPLDELTDDTITSLSADDIA